MGFVKEALRYETPIVAGPSGTTDRLFEFAHILDVVPTTKDKEDFRLTCLGYLLSIDAHSYHEVMLGASSYGLDYHPGPESYEKLRADNQSLKTELKKELSLMGFERELPSYYLSSDYQKKVSQSLIDPRLGS